MLRKKRMIRTGQKYLPQIELLLARHYQGWKTAKILNELVEKFDKPLGLRQIQRIRKDWGRYETIDNHPLAKQFNWVKKIVS